MIWNGSTAQRWFIYNYNGGYKLVAMCSPNLCLDLTMGATGDGTNVQLWEPNNTGAQVFSIYKDGEKKMRNLGGNFNAAILNSNYGIAIINNKSGNVVLSNQSEVSNRAWKFVRQNDGTYTIKSLYDGKMLEVASSSPASGTNVRVAAENGSASQRWYVYSSGGVDMLVPKSAKNLCLDLYNNSSANGTNIQVFTQNNTTAQQYSIYTSTCSLLEGVGINASNGTKVEVGKTLQLKGVLFPSNAANNWVKWSSDNTSIATVDSNGKVKGKSSGKTTIRFYSVYDSSLKASTTVEVIATKSSQTVNGTSSYTKVYGASAFTLNAKTTGNGKLSYNSSNTKVATVSSVGKITIKGTGKATITVTASETSKYKKATKKVTIIVKPKKMAAPTVKSSSKKKVTVTWKKDTRATGYDIQYSTSSSFKSGNKITSVSKNGTIKKTLSNLKSGKTYYVRIRAYKTIDGKKVAGAWSGKKSMKVK